MNRRATLATLLGQKQPKRTVQQHFRTAQLPMLSGLTPYTGPWGFEQAAHLLRRTTFGPTAQQIQTAVDSGLEATLTELFLEREMPPPPVNYYYAPEPAPGEEPVVDVPIGETWVDGLHGPNRDANTMRERSLKAWTIELWLEETLSIREKMTLFWHNHFVVQSEIVEDPRFIYRYITLLRENALGNFRELAKKVTIDPAMLRYLNGNLNEVGNPNENYARELLELFTVGKGDLAGEGDYTTFTEQDVIEIAKVLTGWRDQGYRRRNPEQPVDAYFEAEEHDTSNKQLSYRFNDAVIENAGENEYANLIDVIFQSEQAAPYICRKLYQWFVYYDISEQAEQDVIQPMAQLLRDSDFEIQPVVEALLRSAHFYDILSIGPMIKNPIDFTLSAVKPFSVQFPENQEERYTLYLELFDALRPMQMEMYNPPEVAGWKAYYQRPQYFRAWINSITLPSRQRITNSVAGRGIESGLLSANIDVLTFVETLSNPTDPNQLIRDMAAILHPRPLLDSQILQLKELLIPGLPDFEWTVEYGMFREDPENSDLAQAVENKLRTLLRAMMGMAEFYLS